MIDRYVIAWFGPQADDISDSLTWKDNLICNDLLPDGTCKSGGVTFTLDNINAVTILNNYRT